MNRFHLDWSKRGVRILLSVALPLAATVALTTLYSLQQSNSKLEQQVAHQQAVVTEMRDLARQLENRRGDAKPAVGQTRISSLLPWIEKQISELGLEENVKQIAPSGLEEKGEYRQRAVARLKDIEMNQLLKLVYRMESEPGISVIRVKSKREREDDMPLPDGEEKSAKGLIALVLEVGLL